MIGTKDPLLQYFAHCYNGIILIYITLLLLRILTNIKDLYTGMHSLQRDNIVF